MSEREELSSLVMRAGITYGPEVGLGEACDRVADAILAAGYGKAQTVTTVGGLNALNPGALVKTAKCEQIWQRQASGGWVCLNYGDDIEYIPDIIIGPATVLHNP